MSKKPAALDLVQDKPWAVTRAKLDEIDAFINLRLAGGIVTEAEIDAIQGKSGPGAEDPPYETINGVAVIPVWGTLSKRANMVSRMSGGTSTQLLVRNLHMAFEDPAVSAIVLDIDSPGGTVDGTKAAADYLLSMRGTKPVTAFADGLMASAAYWIGSAADRILASADAEVGSIGVALTHYDMSAHDEKAGIKRTVLSAGQYKRIASDEKPLSDEGRDYLQTMVDTYYSMFVDGVAKNRGVSTEAAIAMADGKIHIGTAAVAAGLVDGIATLTEAIKLTLQEVSAMDYEKLKADHGDLYSQILAEGAASVDVQTPAAAAAQAATAAERERVTKIMAMAGPDSVKLAAVTEGKGYTEALEAVNAALAAEKTKDLAALAAAAPAPLGQQAAETPPAEELPVDEQAKKDYAASADLKKEFPTEASYVAFKKAEAAGKAKILKKTE